MEMLWLRFHLTAREPIYFPAAKSANVLRGAFGATLKRIASDEYPRVFEPTSTDGPSGLKDLPRPFVFRARNLDGRTIAVGEGFSFQMNLNLELVTGLAETGPRDPRKEAKDYKACVIAIVIFSL